MTAKDHNKLLGIFFYIQAGLSAFGGLMAALIYGGMGAMVLSSARRSEDEMMGGIFMGLGIVVAIIFIVFAAFQGFTAWKMHNEQKVGRVLGIIASCLCLLSFPLGTALGVYGLWFLIGDQGRAFYEGHEITAASPPPPPNSWQ